MPSWVVIDQFGKRSTTLELPKHNLDALRIKRPSINVRTCLVDPVLACFPMFRVTSSYFLSILYLIFFPLTDVSIMTTGSTQVQSKPNGCRVKLMIICCHLFHIEEQQDVALVLRQAARHGVMRR